MSKNHSRTLQWCRKKLGRTRCRLEDPIDGRYGPILTVNLIKKLGELIFVACIFIQNNANSTCPLENSVMQKFEQKWRETISLNPRHKTLTNHKD
jgi:hypothetical protein